MAVDSVISAIKIGSPCCGLSNQQYHWQQPQGEALQGIRQNS